MTGHLSQHQLSHKQAAAAAFRAVSTGTSRTSASLIRPSAATNFAHSSKTALLARGTATAHSAARPAQRTATPSKPISVKHAPPHAAAGRHVTATKTSGAHAVAKAQQGARSTPVRPVAHAVGTVARSPHTLQGFASAAHEVAASAPKTPSGVNAALAARDHLTLDGGKTAVVLDVQHHAPVGAVSIIKI